MRGKQEKNRNKGIGGWLFLAVVLLLYGMTGLLDGELALAAITTFTQMLAKVLPVLVIVFFLIFAINLLLAPERVNKYLGSQSGMKGWLAATIGGILSTGPVYPWYALLKDLREKGMKTSLVATFLYSRAVKLPLLPMLVHYFGITYTLVLSGYLIVFSIISGLIMGKVEAWYTTTEKSQD